MAKNNRELEKLELQVLEGLRSGEAVDVTPRMWDELRRKLRNRRNQVPQPDCTNATSPLLQRLAREVVQRKPE